MVQRAGGHGEDYAAAPDYLDGAGLLGGEEAVGAVSFYQENELEDEIEG